MGKLRKMVLVYVLLLLIFDVTIFYQPSMNVEGQGEEEINENPFKTYYSEPNKISDMIIDSNSNKMYVGCEYGLIIRDLKTENFQVISYFEGLDNSHIKTMELDEEGSRLFILVYDYNYVYVMNLSTNEITEKYHLDSFSTMVHSDEYDHMLYEPKKNQLFLGSDAGIALLNLSSLSFDFYDIFFFDLDFAEYEIVGNTLNAETADFFSINGFDYNENTNELFIATSNGLYIFNSSSNKFKNFRNSSLLSNHMYDVLFVEEMNSLYLGSNRLIRYDLSLNVSTEYPQVKGGLANDTNRSIFSLGYISQYTTIYATLYSQGMALFNPETPTILDSFWDEHYEGLEIIHSCLPCIEYNEIEDLLYVGLGRIYSRSSKWTINYTYESKVSTTEGVGFKMDVSDTHKHLKTSQITHTTSQNSYTSNGFVVYSYNFENDLFEPYNITNNIRFGLGKIYDMKIDEETDSVYISTGNLLSYNSDGTVDQLYDRTFMDGLIYDIELNDDLLYMAWDNGLKIMNLSTNTIWNITDTNLTKCVSLDVGRNSGKLYVGVKKGVVVFDPKSNETSFFNKYRAGQYPGFGGIAVDNNEEFVYFAGEYSVYRLNLSNGSYEMIDERSNFGKIEIHQKSNSPIIISTNDRLISINPDILDLFPDTNTISSFYIDQEKNILYAVTGEYKGPHISQYMYSSENPEGLYIYDITNKSCVNYTINSGLPSNMLSLVAVNTKLHTIHITGEGFYTVVNISDLSKNITRKEIPVATFEPTQIAQQVLGFKGETDYSFLYIGLSTGTLLGILTFIIEPTKFKLLTMFATPLYSRLKKDEVMDNETRGRIRGHIESDPGIHYNELKKKLKLKNGSLSYHLQVLEREGFIKSKNNGIFKHFFPGDMKLPAKIIRMTELQKVILKKTREDPGISQVKIAESIGGSSSTVNYNINILAKKGILNLKKVGKKTECYLIEEA